LTSALKNHPFAWALILIALFRAPVLSFLLHIYYLFLCVITVLCWRWRQLVPQIWWYMPTNLHFVTPQKARILILTVVAT
jgi:hypothetical protein